MSASSKKKLRKEQNTEVMTERQKKERSEARKLKAMTATFVVVLVTIVCIFLGSIGWNIITTNGLIEKATIALTVGDHKLNSITMNYFFRDAVMTERNNYGDYAQYLLAYDVTKPLNEQPKEGYNGTWADYYMDQAIENARAVYTMYDKAQAAKFELPESYKTDISNTIMQAQFTAALSYGMDYDVYLAQIYGNGANAKNYEEFLTIQATATAYYSQYQQDLYASYTPEQIKAFESGKENNYDAYSFYYYTLKYETFLKGGTKNEDGTITYSDAEKDAARKAMEEASVILSAATSRDELEAAIAEVTATEPEATEPEVTEPEATEPEATEGEATEPEATEPEATEPEATEGEATEPEATEPEATAPSTSTTITYKTSLSSDVAYTSLNADYAEWLSAAERKEGNVKAFPAAKTSETRADGSTLEVVNSYTVIMYVSTNHNETPLANVRHLLVAFEGGTQDANGKTTYSDAEKAAAKAEAEKLLAEFEAGDKSDASFTALVKKHSDDTGVTENEGLYKDVSKDSDYVDSFKNWATSHIGNVGSYGIIESTYGYHIMFYVSDSQTTYRQYLIKEDMISNDMTAWEKSVTEAVVPVEGNFSKIKMDLIVQPATAA